MGNLRLLRTRYTVVTPTAKLRRDFDDWEQSHGKSTAAPAEQRYVRWTAEDLARGREAAERGLSNVQIAELLGRTPVSVQNYAWRLGWAERARHPDARVPPWYVVGTRADDGSSCVLAEAATREQAELAAARFREHLEGYAAIEVQEVGV